MSGPYDGAVDRDFLYSLLPDYYFLLVASDFMLFMLFMVFAFTERPGRLGLLSRGQRFPVFPASRLLFPAFCLCFPAFPGFHDFCLYGAAWAAWAASPFGFPAFRFRLSGFRAKTMKSMKSKNTQAKSKK